MQEAIADKKLPGAVVLIGRGDRVLYQKAIGNRALVPAVEPMSLDTMFDLASLTKVVATTTSVMMLVERGRAAAERPGGDVHPRVRALRQGRHHHPPPDDARVGPAAGRGSRRGLDRIGHGHRARDRRGADVSRPASGSSTATSTSSCSATSSSASAACRWIGSRRRRIFDPLGMKDTMFLPAASLRPRIAPTESCTPFGWPCQGADSQMLRGVVHDPTARRMGGVAGHAGLFSTAADLADLLPDAPRRRHLHGTASCRRWRSRR